MVSLLDVNVLVALFDPMHAYHEAAHSWFEVHRTHGWATCPLSENGLVRIVSNPSYPGRRTTVSDALNRLQQFRKSGDHVFWPDSVSICDEGVLIADHIQGHRQLTDIYLLALAVRQNGVLATFDQKIAYRSVASATAAHLQVLT